MRAKDTKITWEKARALDDLIRIEFNKEKNYIGIYWAYTKEDLRDLESRMKWRKLEEQAKVSYLAGLKEGVRLFAWWKDGIQYVGSGLYTLEKALKEIEEENAQES